MIQELVSKVKEPFLKSEYITKHNMVKLLALFLSIVVWFYLKGMQDVQLTRTAMVSVKVETGMGVVSKSAEVLVVEIKGNKDEVNDLREKDIIAKIDLTKYSGKKTIDVTKEKINFLNLGYSKVVSISPAVIEIEIDRLVEKILPVKVEFSGEIDDDHVVNKVYVNPKEVKIKGPETKLKELQAIQTIPVDLTGRVGNFTEMVALESLFFEGKLKLVNVHVTVNEKLTPREFSDIPINIFTATAQNLAVKLSISKANLKVLGPKEALEKVTAADIKLFIAVAGLASGTYELPIQLISIKDIRLIEVEPRIINVTIGAPSEKIAG